MKMYRIVSCLVCSLLMLSMICIAGTENASLIVNIFPAEVNNEGAGWHIKDLHPSTLWYSTGQMLVLAGGIYTIEFRPNIKGWRTPQPKQVSLVSGKVVTVSGVYERLKGSLQVKINPPEVIEAGAQWRLMGKEAWKDSGEIENNIPTGTYMIELKRIEGWKPELNISVNIEENQLTIVTVSYTKKLGSLVVNIEPPDAVRQGAGWRMFGETTYRSSGSKLENILAKEYLIEFAKIPNWIEPEPIRVKVEERKTVTVTGKYKAWSDVFYGPGQGPVEGAKEGETDSGKDTCKTCGSLCNLASWLGNLLTLMTVFIILTGISKNKSLPKK